jgi:uncharacterized cupin superfamily protein
MAKDSKDPVWIVARVGVPAVRKTIYPPPFAARVAGRERQRLGDVFGLKNFGVNLTRLEPGAQSALKHRHAVQDEFVYVLEGTITLITDEGEFELRPGCCAGFPAGGRSHHLVNRSSGNAAYLEVGDRLPGDSAVYPDDDLALSQDTNGNWVVAHKDGRPY